MDARGKMPRSAFLVSVMAFLAIGFLTMFIGLSLLVGLTDISPRNAALVVLAPALIFGVIGAMTQPVRDFFASLWG